MKIQYLKKRVKIIQVLIEKLKLIYRKTIVTKVWNLIYKKPLMFHSNAKIWIWVKLFKKLQVQAPIANLGNLGQIWKVPSFLENRSKMRFWKLSQMRDHFLGILNFLGLVGLLWKKLIRNLAQNVWWKENYKLLSALIE